MDNTAETCCWRRSCCQWCRYTGGVWSSGKTMHQHIAIVRQSSFCAVRQPSSSVLTYSQLKYLNIADHQISGMMQRLICVSRTNLGCGQVVAAAYWELRFTWIPAEHGGWCDWLAVKTENNLNCKSKKVDILTIPAVLLVWNLSCHVTKQLAIWPSTFSREQCNFDPMHEFCISQGTAVIFLRCGGWVYNHLTFLLDFVYQNYSNGLFLTELLKI